MVCVYGGLNAPAPVNLALGKVTVSGGDVQYAGGAPTLLCGVVQINLVVPMRATPGPLFLSIQAATGSSFVNSAVGTTIAVK